MKLLGITGRKQSGKDSVYKALCKQHSPSVVQRIAFADELKEEVARACGCTTQFIEANKDIFRPMLQWWGTDYRRKLCGDNYWIFRFLTRLNSLPTDKVFLCVVTDVRFLNEAQMIRELGGKIWSVTRPTARATPPDAHRSETELALIKADYDILNLHGLEDLDYEVRLAWQKTMNT